MIYLLINLIKIKKINKGPFNRNPLFGFNIYEYSAKITSLLLMVIHYILSNKIIRISFSKF